MKEVIFSTGNSTKLKEAIEACTPFNINIIHKNFSIDEIQSSAPLEIALHKARTGYGITQQPIVINDSFWQIPALNGFPGGYMKDIIHWFAPKDFVNLMKDKTDRRVCITECIVYKDTKTEKLISKDFWGEIAQAPSGSGNSIDQVAIFNGMTLGEHHRQGNSTYDPKDYIWDDFAKWFSKYSV